MPQPSGYGTDLGQGCLSPALKGRGTQHVRLMYQSVSWEYLKFLAETSETGDRGHRLYEAWNQTSRCPATVMGEVSCELGQPPAESAPVGSRGRCDRYGRYFAGRVAGFTAGRLSAACSTAWRWARVGIFINPGFNRFSKISVTGS